MHPANPSQILDLKTFFIFNEFNLKKILEVTFIHCTIKSMKNLRKLNQAGFTLIELMVVVAIIGILATIAIPQYRKFQGKARQSEANISLGTVKDLESAHAAANEFYSACLGSLGFGRESTSAKIYYAVGFGAATGTALPFQWVSGTTAATCSAGANQTTFASNACVGSGCANAAISSSEGSASTTTYSAVARGSIGGSSNDIWTVDQNGSLINSQSGI